MGRHCRPGRGCRCEGRPSLSVPRGSPCPPALIHAAASGCDSCSSGSFWAGLRPWLHRPTGRWWLGADGSEHARRGTRHLGSELTLHSGLTPTVAPRGAEQAGRPGRVRGWVSGQGCCLSGGPRASRGLSHRTGGSQPSAAPRPPVCIPGVGVPRGVQQIGHGVVRFCVYRSGFSFCFSHFVPSARGGVRTDRSRRSRRRPRRCPSPRPRPVPGVEPRA